MRKKVISFKAPSSDFEFHPDAITSNYIGGTNCITTQNVTTGVNGDLDGHHVAANTSGGQHGTSGLGGSLIAGNYYRIGFIVKAAEYGFVSAGGGFTVLGGWKYACWNLNTGLYNGGNTKGNRITPLNDGWYKVECWESCKSSANMSTEMKLNPTDTAVSQGADFTGDGVSGIYFWGSEFMHSKDQLPQGTCMVKDEGESLYGWQMVGGAVATIETTTDSDRGKFHVKIISTTGSTAYAYDQAYVLDGETYKISFWARQPTGTGGKIVCQNTTPSINISIDTTEWKYYEATFVSGTTGDTNVIMYSGNPIGEYIEVDNLSVEKVI